MSVKSIEEIKKGKYRDDIISHLKYSLNIKDYESVEYMLDLVLTMPEFSDELKICEDIFNKHKKTKGDSWKKCTIDFLETKLLEEINEWLDIKKTVYQVTDIEDNVIELADMVNVALMLMNRLQELRLKKILNEKKVSL